MRARSGWGRIALLLVGALVLQTAALAEVGQAGSLLERLPVVEVPADDDGSDDTDGEDAPDTAADPSDTADTAASDTAADPSDTADTAAADAPLAPAAVEEGRYVASVLADEPLLYWRYGEPSQTDPIADHSGHERHGRYVIDNFVNNNVSVGVSGALANDPDTAFGKSGTYHYYGATFARRDTAEGLPEGNAPRTVEGWVRFDNTVVLARWGGFSVGAVGDAITITRDGAADRLPLRGVSLTDGRWHHLAVSYDGAEFAFHLDGRPVGTLPAPVPLTTATTGAFEAGIVPTGRSSGFFDELVVHGTALSAEQVADRFDASGNAVPTAPQAVTATPAGDNALEVAWEAPEIAGAPPAQQAVEHYVVVARRGAQVLGARSVPGSQTATTLSGLPAGDGLVATVRAVNGFGSGPEAAATAQTVAGATETYAGTVAADGPALWWRYGEPGGTLVADASGRGHDGRYVLDNFVNNGVDRGVVGALANDPDPAFGRGGSTYHYYGATFARALDAEGLPGGDEPRTVEAWVRFNNTVVLARWGGFSVGAVGNALTITGAGPEQRIHVTELSLTDGRWHHVAVTYDGERLTGYVDGARVGDVAAPEPMATPTSGGFEAGIIPTGQSNGFFDELAVFPAALTDEQVAARFVASGNRRPDAAPDVVATTSPAFPNRVSVSWSPASAGAPASQQAVEHYRVVARRGDTVHGAVSVAGNQTQVVVSGLPAGDGYVVEVTGVNGFGYGAPSPAAPVEVTGAERTYASAVVESGPSLYWRYGEPTGTLIADASGRGHDGRYVLDNFVNNGVDLGVPGAVANDPDTAFGRSRSTYHYYGATFARALNARGLPGGDEPRTVGGWVRFSNTVVLARWGGFSVGAVADALTITTGSESLRLPVDVRLTDGTWRHVAVAYDGEAFRGYLDGRPIGSVRPSAPMATATSGGFEAGIIPTGRSTGFFDELAIFPRALSQTELRNHLRAGEDEHPVDPSVGEANITATIDGPATVRRGRTTRYWVTVRNRGEATAYGVTGTLRLPEGLVYEVPSDPRPRCEAVLDDLEARGVEIEDREALLDSENCTARGPRTTDGPEDLVFRVEELGPGAEHRMPIDVTQPTDGARPLTVSLAPPSSPYFWSGSAEDFAADPVVTSFVSQMVAAAGEDEVPDPEEVHRAVRDVLLNALALPFPPIGLDTVSVWGMAVGGGLMLYGHVAASATFMALGAAVFTAAGALALALALFALFTLITQALTSFDPNDKLGPNGVGEEGWITADTPMRYTIRFENDPERASAPAQLVEISDVLAPELDAATLDVQRLTVAGRTVDFTPVDGGWEAALPSADGLAAPIRAEASFDDDTRELLLRVYGVGTGTGQDAYDDFLPPNRTSPEGEGEVDLVLALVDDVADGATVANGARITFDGHEVDDNFLDTPVISNRIDRSAPTSAVVELAEESTTPFTVRWTGEDGDGSGVGDYTVYVSTDGGPLRPWLHHTPESEAVFDGEPGRRYGFVVQARDRVGNMEALKAAVETTTLAVAPPDPDPDPDPDGPGAGGPLGPVLDLVQDLLDRLLPPWAGRG
jgi:uncharacterized repeat protein (TIGR01451 family)